MLNRNWMKRHFDPFAESKSHNRLRQTRRNVRRRLRIETLESRLLLAADLGGDPSAVFPNETTGFSHAPGTGDYSAQIDLAQVDSITSVAVGAGEPSAQSTLRYVSPTGGGGAGTQADPWSLDYANNVVQIGETLLMLGGTYDGVIKPKRSGTPGNPITYKPAPGASVQLRAIGSDYAVNIGKDYILVEGLTVSRRDSPGSGAYHRTNVIIFSNHVTVRNMYVVNNGDPIADARVSSETGIVARGQYGLVENNHVENMKFGISLGTDRRGSFYNVIRGNTIADPVYDGIHIGNGDGAALHHLIENNIIFGAMVSDGITFDGRNDSNPTNHLGINEVIVRNNAIFNSGENNIDLKATKNIVIEGNFFWKGFGDNDGSNVLFLHGGSTSLTNDEQGGYSITKGANTDSQDVIIRNNVSIDSNQATIALRGYKVYNNTFLNNRRNYLGPNQPSTSPGVRKPADAGIVGNGTGSNAAILNNIIGDHGYEVVLRTSGSAAIDGNAYYNSFQTPRFSAFTDNFNWTSESFASWQSWLQTKSNFTGDEANSQIVAGGPGSLFANVPGQVIGDPALYNFELKTNSPAIDSGVFLTKTVGSGSGTTMTVADSGMFFDGFGITLGDEIQLASQTARARITNISGNTLTLSSALSWTHGQGLSLSYEGSKPDSGAIEFTGSVINFPPTAVDDSVTTEKGIAVSTGNLLANDTDPNPGDTLSIQSVTLPSHGTIFDTGNGTFAYLPHNGYTGSDSFTYVVSDGIETDTGTVNITVASPGDFDSDGDVDGADFLSWQRGLGTTHVADDLTDWQDDYGASATVAAAVTAESTATEEDEELEEAVFKAEFLNNDAGIVLGLDLQKLPANRLTFSAVFDDTLFDGEDELPVDGYFALPSKEEDSLRSSLLEKSDLLSEEETSDELLDGLFELLGSSIV